MNVDTKRHDFTVRLACESGEVICAADGDVITTVVALRSPQNSRLLRSKAVLMQSDGLSKNASRVSASLRADAALVFVELLVFDVDGLPIRVSQCVLLKQTVNIEANLEKSLLSVDQAIMVGVVGALLLSLAGISIYVVRKHKHRARELVLSFLRQEMLLAFKILIKLLDIAGDSTRPKFAPAFALAPTAASVCLWFGACAVGTSIGMYRDGTRDLFIATVVFLPLAIVVSAASRLRRSDRMSPSFTGWPSLGVRSCNDTRRHAALAGRFHFSCSPMCCIETKRNIARRQTATMSPSISSPWRCYCC